MRKTFFVIGRRRGHCPCHNPSDSGVAMQTGCEAITGWAKQDRFKRVCPLLAQTDKGAWVCGVSASEVRPFWGRAIAVALTIVVLGWAMVVFAVFGGMRSIGYEVQLSQIAWPPAWHELRGIRADLFIAKARASYNEGQVRNAIKELSVAYELNPHHYQVGMMLAQFYQAGSPSRADELYRKLLGEHEARRNETARAWFQSLLSRGRLQDIAELARRQLLIEPEHSGAWVHAVLFATRYSPNNKLLAEIRDNETVLAPVRRVIDLAMQVRNSDPAGGRRLLLGTPLTKEFTYEKVYRVEELLRLGFPQDALRLLAAVRGDLAGRDVARLIFATYAELGDKIRLHREFSGFLARDRKIRASEVTLLAVHLINYPDQELLTMLGSALPRVPMTQPEKRLEAAIGVFCAAGIMADSKEMEAAKKLISETFESNPLGLVQLELFFMGKSSASRIESLLPTINPLSLELNYALLGRYLQVPGAGG